MKPRILKFLSTGCWAVEDSGHVAFMGSWGEAMAYVQFLYERAANKVLSK